MKARPILMSAPMVRALLEGRKTQTRRIIKPQPYIDKMGNFYWNGACYGQGVCGQPRIQAIASPIPDSKTKRVLCPYGKPGDLLWVRESICRAKEYGGIGYCADTTWYPNYAWPWKKDVVPSIHMPRWLSRLTLEISEVRVQHKQDINVTDAIAEGLDPVYTAANGQVGWFNYLNKKGDECFFTDARKSYASLTDSINGEGSWDANPWVWALTFKVHQQNVDEFLKARAA